MPGKIKLSYDVPLADLTTFRIGGKARFFVRAETEKDIVETIEFVDSNNLDLFVLGGGSNILISDDGYQGLVLHIATRGISIGNEKGKTVLVTARAGEDWDEFVEFCVKRNLAGIECLSGIPGLIGGTPIQNVGAYGQEVSETIVSVRVFDRITGKIRTMDNDDCGFGYRKSVFNSTAPDRYIVLSVTYALTKAGNPKIVYKDLIEEFPGKAPTLIETRQAVCRIREKKGMLVRQGGHDAQSAGSFFKNPLVSIDGLREIESVATDAGLGVVPMFRIDQNQVKVPAAWLIEKAGFEKGFKKGNAGLSTKHSLAITNRGGATASEIVTLKELIQERVKDIFGVKLIPEPNFIGFKES